MGKSKKRSRSKTPEVAWESLPAEPTANFCIIAGDTAKKPQKVHRTPPVPDPKLANANGSKPGKIDKNGVSSEEPSPEATRITGEVARKTERQAYRSLVSRLIALQGDPKTESHIAEKHPELKSVASECGSSRRKPKALDRTKDSLSNWFERLLKGGNRHGPAARAAICNKIAETLRTRSEEICSTLGSRVAEVLEEGNPVEEGPLISSLMGKELVGSSYEGVFISRERHGIYLLGDDEEDSGLPRIDQDGATVHAPIRAAVKVIKGRLVVDGFFHHDDDEYNPVKVPIGPFLTVYFEGVSLREAYARWADVHARNEMLALAQNGDAARNIDKDGASTNTVPQIRNGVVNTMPARNVEQDTSLRAIQVTLPPGWEIRESRSKKGVYYYANPSKGLSQLDRPKA